MNKYVISYSYIDSFYQGPSRYKTLVTRNCIHEAESMTEKEFYNLKKKLSKGWVWNNTDIERDITILSWQKLDEEVEALSNANPSYIHTCDVVDREDVLDIIDKYKAESEEMNGSN